MEIVKLEQCTPLVAGDKTHLREILRPACRPDIAIRYSLAHAQVAPGERSTPHRLRSSEVYFILEGRGTMHIGDEADQVAPGDTVYIPPGAVQYIVNDGSQSLRFLCIVDPAWRAEDEEGV